MNIMGTGIFWTTILEVTAILFLATLIGRIWCALFPPLLRAPARFYLGPVLGLASLTIAASLLGRFLPMGNAIAVPLVTILFLTLALLREQNKMSAFRHALMTSIFAIVCGVSVLGPLFVYGALNAHNDTFTYLQHSHWLQVHAFNEVITPEAVIPQNTQIAIYQGGNLRMGGSFLLAFFQALFQIRWSYEVYPSVVIAALAVCFLGVGFPLSRVLSPMHRSIRLMLLSLPAFTLGGMVFGANFGFMPQTIGLAFGATMFFTAGPLLRWITVGKKSRSDIIKAALPMSILLTSATFAYSELVPFLLLTMFVSSGIVAFRFFSLSKIVLFGAVVLCLSVLLLNTELLRTYAALKTQVGAVVGNPVDWSLLGYIAHAFGIHGGAWDMLQWTVPESSGVLPFFMGLFFLLTILVILLVGIRSARHGTLSVTLLPAVIMLIFLLSGVVYFRYAVASPFPKGVGQSWSQFKLSDWAHPFAIAIVLFAVAALRPKKGKLFDRAVHVLFAFGLMTSTIIGVDRIRPLMDYYKGVTNLNQFYVDFRDTVLSNCLGQKPIYLALSGKDHKFRQMATLYLYDKNIISDWSDDGYIAQLLPPELKKKKLMSGSYVVEPLLSYDLVNKGKVIGPFRIGLLDNQHGTIEIASVTGAYDRESDDKNWWHWVEHKVNFTLMPLIIPEHATRTKLYFDYRTRGQQTLRVQCIKHDGTSIEYQIKSNGLQSEIWEKVVDVHPAELNKISIETDGKATPLGNGDSRVAAFIVRNVLISPVTP